MDYQIVWTESAQEDLKQLVSFIAADDPVWVQDKFFPYR
jgi:plasmid stabilization system protein ParE